MDSIFWPYALKRFVSLESNLELRQAREFKDEYRLMKQALIRLKKRRLVKILNRAEGLELALTKQGEVERLRSSILNRQDRLERGYCYVIFDIPEDAKLARDALRFFLKQAEFQQVQKSVWRTSKDVVQDLRAFINVARVEKWVTIIVGMEK
ncbi:MAG: hypothetical protein V1821_02215, partial [bacterium]